jgi:hypothetical protein
MQGNVEWDCPWKESFLRWKGLSMQGVVLQTEGTVNARNRSCGWDCQCKESFLRWKGLSMQEVVEVGLYLHSYFVSTNDTFFNGPTAPSGPRPAYYRGFTITLRHTTLGKTPLDEWSARRRNLYLTTHNTYNKHPCLRQDSNPQFQQASGRRPTP